MLSSLLDFILHIDAHLISLTTTYGMLTYLFLFLIIFAETGLVVLPFLPGDSLLFAAGAIAALGTMDLPTLLIVLISAAVIGDTVNYWVGHFLGNKMIENPRLPIKKAHVEKTQEFYKKHGGKTIVLARFIPIVRTFAPFVAGIGTMNYKQFLSYNLIGGVIWVTTFTLTGYFFGNMPFVKHNFELVVFSIIGISVLPMVYEYIKAKSESKAKG